jgi:ankyrin repeat protein
MQEVVKVLLEAGANPMLKDRHGRSALLEAVTSGHEVVVDMLRKYKATWVG